MRTKTMLWLATLPSAACFSEPPFVISPVVMETSGESQQVQTTGDDDTGGSEASPPGDPGGSSSAAGDATSTDPGDSESATEETGDPHAACGDGIPDVDEDCDDGNLLDGDGCSADCVVETAGCAATATPIAQDIERGIAVCSDPRQQVCEENFSQLCAPGWHLCSPTEHMAKNEDWTVDLQGQRALGSIRCRASGGAGHYTVLTTAADGTNNCEIGSSRPACPSAFGCNETLDSALCCARLPSCGDGVVDPPFEECDDANVEEDDDCTVDCTATFGTGPYC